jgi:hypothetical protein
MLYKTIMLALLRQRPQMHRKLRNNHTLLPTLEHYARQLQASHEAWMEKLTEAQPDSDPSQIKSEALELALKAMEQLLKADSSARANAAISPDEAIAFIRKHTPSD